jgi:serine/threonine protein kinase
MPDDKGQPPIPGRPHTPGVNLDQIQEGLRENLKLNEDLIGRRIGNVLIESKIATGGMAVVYLGRQEITNRKVAVKVLRPERHLSYRDREYFVREAKALGQIRHPHLVELYGTGVTDDGRHYMILEFVPGRTLRELIEQEGPVPPLRCVRLFRQLLLALEAAHATGIVHRDLKLDNVLIEALEGGKERLRLADLGLVKFTQKRLPALTGHGMTVGTPCYMSPEQVRGESLDDRSDLYTVGVMMFEAMTSYLPYPEEKSVDGLLDHILDTKPARLTQADRKFGRIPGIQALLDRLMAKDPNERPSSAGEVIQELDRLVASELAQDVAQAQAQRPNQPQPASPPDEGEDHVPDGALVTFSLRRATDGAPTSAPPQVVRKLRAWLEEGGECCVVRQESLVTFGLRHSTKAIQQISALPKVLEKLRELFPDYTLGAGVAFGSYLIDADGEPVAKALLERSRQLAQGAQDGQVLIPRGAAATFGIEQGT